MSEAIVSLRNVVKRYTRGKQNVDVLENLNLDIAQGEFVALMGPSGSGKTTLLNLIGGLDQPTSGEISVGGQRIDRLSSGELAHWRAHNVGFVFQFYNLMPVLSAEGTVELPLLLTKLPAARSSAWPSRVPWCRIRSCWYAMSPPATSIARPRMRFSVCCRS